MFLYKSLFNLRGIDLFVDIFKINKKSVSDQPYNKIMSI